VIYKGYESAARILQIVVYFVFNPFIPIPGSVMMKVHHQGHM
jgi:hypothetical protein